MESIPQPPRFESDELIARRTVAPSSRTGLHARFDALPPVDDLMPERQRLRLRPASLPVAAACLASTLAEGCTIVAEMSGAMRVVDDRTLATLVLIAVADIALMVRFGRFRRPLALATTNWHTAAFIARVLLLLPTYLVALHPFFGWLVAPIAWNALAVFTFALLWWDLTVAARRGVD